MNKTLISLALAAACLPAFAQVGVTNTSDSVITNAPNIYTGSQLPSDTHSSAKFNSTQAMTAPAVFGNVSGCVGITGQSGAIAWINLSSTQLSEAESCYAIGLADRAGRLQKDGAGQFTMQSVIELESYCAVPVLKKIIERTRMYECAETREARTAKAAGQQPAKVATAAPKGFEGANMNDPYRRMAAGLPPQ